MDNFTLQFRELIEIGKLLKADIVYVFGNTIYGTDSNFTYLKQMAFDNVLGINICYDQKLMNDFIKLCTDTIVLEGNVLLSNIERFVVNNDVHIRNIINLDKKINEIIITNTNTMNVDNVRDNQQFENAIALKSNQGIGLYKVSEKYILSIFKGLLPINKGDKVSLSIYDINDNRFLTRFIVTKPKIKKIITVSVMYLKIR